jgi:hypothetical protein
MACSPSLLWGVTQGVRKAALHTHTHTPFFPGHLTPPTIAPNPPTRIPTHFTADGDATAITAAPRAAVSSPAPTLCTARVS